MADAGQDNNKKPDNADTTVVKPPAADKDKKAVKAAEKNPHPVKKKSGGQAVALALWLLLLVLAGLAVAGWYVYKAWLDEHALIDNLKQQLVTLQTQQTAVITESQQRMQAMQQQQNEFQGSVSKLLKRNQNLRKDWLVLEAEYLIKLANHRLLLERDIKTAIVALTAADTRLRDTGDPGLIGVRQRIAQDLVALRKIPQADLVGMSLTLSALSKDIEQLPLKTPDFKSFEKLQEERKARKHNVDTWQQLPGAIWQDLKGLIIIQHHDEAVRPLLSPQQGFFLIENLRLQLEQARLALLSLQNDVFKERIGVAYQWVEKYFNSDSETTAAMLDTLAKLQQAQITPELPDITQTFRELEAYRLQQQSEQAPDSIEKNTQP